MKEGKAATISLSTFFLILAIIVIVIMGLLIYKLNNDKTAEIQKSTKLQAQANNFNADANTLQESISNISETINTNNTENTISTNKTSNQSKLYSFSDVAGTYKGLFKDNSTIENSNKHYVLNLFENGTFLYENYIDIQSGIIGNYTIIDNTIILNYWFRTGNDASLSVISGQKKLNINENNSITDSQPENSNSSNLVLNRISSSEETEKDTIINYYIDNCYIYNKVLNSENE